MISLMFLFFSAFAADQYVETFDEVGNPGQPFPRVPDYWFLLDQESPAVLWADVVPGDGHSYITVDSANVDNDGGHQAIGFGRVGPGHSINVRMRGALIPGYVGHIYTRHHGARTFDGIDIELVADDVHGVDGEHGYGEWTDVRYAVYDGTPLGADWPTVNNNSMPVHDGIGQRVSHYDDDAFHTYSIDWYEDRVDFYVDGVLQFEVPNGAPETEAELLIGFRDHAMAGLNEGTGLHEVWSGEHTMVIDYVRISGNGEIDGPDGFLEPTITITANGVSDSLVAGSDEAVRVEVDIDSGDLATYPADTWIRATSTVSGAKPFWWQPGTGWVPSWRPLRALGGPLTDLHLWVVDQPMPPGSYRVDVVIDGVGEPIERTFSDTLFLEIQ